jgi:heme exporter protein A
LHQPSRQRLKLIATTVNLERGARTVIAGLSFTVVGGEALILTGANGAGKTTLLRALGGMLGPSAGSIAVEGGVADVSLPEQSHFIGHQNGLKSSLTVEENLTFWGSYLGGGSNETRAKVEGALARFNLTALAAIPAGLLSAGQKRRLSLARLLVADRPIWLLDEPTVSLDATSVAILGEVVNLHVAEGGIAIAATHLQLGLTASREMRLTPSRPVEDERSGRASL